MAEGKGTYSGIFKMLGAAKAAADNRRVAASMGRVLSMSGRLRAGMLGMTSALAGTGAALVAVGMAARRVVNAYGEYTIAQSRIRTTLAAQLPNYRAVSAVVGQHADMVGRRLGYSLTESNEAMMTMLQTGLGTHRSMRVFGTAMQLARVADMDTANATRFLTDTMNMFRMEAARSGEEAQHFARRMATQLSVAANMASTDIESLQQAFRYAGGELSSLGFESQDVMSALAALSSVGLRSTTAGTRLRGAIAALHTPSRTTIALFRQWGIQETELRETFYDSTGQIRSMGDGIENLSNLFRRLPTQHARNTALIRLFGRRALAAGATVTGLTEAGDRFAAISERISQTDVTEGTLLDRMAEERTRSFGFQVEQLRQGITDLGIAFGEILFGAMDETGEGFGTHIRQVAAAIRLSGNLENMTAAQRREWEALSPEVRESGQRYRELFVNLSDVLRITADFLRWVVNIANEYPRATAAATGFMVISGGIIPSLTTVWSILKGIVFVLKIFGTGAGIAASGFILVATGVGILTAAVNSAIPSLTSWFEEFVGATEGAANFRATNNYLNRDIATSIPIIGNFVGIWTDVANALIAVVDIISGNRSFFDFITGIRGGPTATERVGGRLTSAIETATREQQQGLRPGETDAEMMARVTESQRMMQEERLAALLSAEGHRTTGSIRTRLRDMGITESPDTIRNMMEMMGRSDIQARGRRLAEDRDLLGPSLKDEANMTGRELTVLTRRSAEAARALASIGSTTVADPDAQSSPFAIPGVEDAYINRGGLIRASSGDVVVSREHLARAVSARRGAMVGPAMGEGVGDRTMTGPMTSSHGGGASEVTVEVPLVIDGTEIARAVGRAHIRHLERSGASFAPEQRRTMRETGFTERVG